MVNESIAYEALPQDCDAVFLKMRTECGTPKEISDFITENWPYFVRAAVFACHTINWHVHVTGQHIIDILDNPIIEIGLTYRDTSAVGRIRFTITPDIPYELWHMLFLGSGIKRIDGENEILFGRRCTTDRVKLDYSNWPALQEMAIWKALQDD